MGAPAPRNPCSTNRLSSYYHQRVAATERLRAASYALAASEAAGLLHEFVRDMGATLGASEIEHLIAIRRSMDLSDIETAIARLAALGLAPWALSTTREISPALEAQAALELVQSLKAQARTLSSLEVAAQLEHGLDTHLTLLLVSAGRAQVQLDDLVCLLEEGLARIDEGELARLWSRVQREFAPDRLRPSLPADSPDLPPQFLAMDDAARTRRKLADYSIHIKPRILASRFAAGVGSYPVEAASPARLLTVRRQPSVALLDPQSEALARAISRTSAVWTKLARRPVTELADALGLAHDAHLLVGSDVRMAENELSSSPVEASAALIHQIQTLLALLDRKYSGSAAVVHALQVHKLGLEVTIPESTNYVAGRDELSLQKGLCRFLLERGVYAEGTKFGRFEADLLSRVSNLAYVVEVKRFSEKRAPTATQLKASLAQLQDYMDKQPMRPRGVLVLYNLSRTLLVGPRRWIRGHFWITAINLAEATGSARRKSIVIEEGASSELVTFTECLADRASNAGRA